MSSNIIHKHITMNELIRQNLNAKVTSVDLEDRVYKMVVAPTYVIYADAAHIQADNIINVGSRALSKFGGCISLHLSKDGTLTLMDICGNKHKTKTLNSVKEQTNYVDLDIIEKMEMFRVDENISCFSCLSDHKAPSRSDALRYISEYHGEYKHDSKYHVGFQKIVRFGQLMDVLVIKELSAYGAKILSKQVANYHVNKYIYSTIVKIV